MRKNKKTNILYIIIAVLMIAIAIIGVLLMTSYTKEEKVTETTTSPAPTDTDTPYYPTVSASGLNAEYFQTDEKGRMTYTDSTVRYFTGIDVSQFQGDIDWYAVADDGIDFAIIRVGARGYGSNGVMFEDSAFEYNIENALKAGLEVGVYFYSQATTVEEAVEEAEYTLELIHGYDITAPVVFDWENMPDTDMRTDDVTSETLNELALAFCKTIENAGYTPSIYFNLSDGYSRYDLSKINEYPFWFAQYEGSFPEFYYSFDMWQYTASGTVDGINTNVDMNISFSEFE